MALIRSIVFTPDGSELFSASNDKTIRVWDVGTGRGASYGPSEARSATAIRARSTPLALSRDGRLLAAGGRTRATGQVQPIRLYDLNEGALIGLLKGHDGAVLSLDFSADGERLVSAAPTTLP
jgi:WD40 repeat protein